MEFEEGDVLMIEVSVLVDKEARDPRGKRETYCLYICMLKAEF